MSRPTGKTHQRRHTNQLEILWDELLSRQPERIRTAYASLQDAEQKAVYSHLRRMATEPDWQPAQRQSARAALEALEGQAH